jgi:putative ABC transport system permease protein
MLLVKIASRNVFRQKRRTLLTVLTMFIGFSLSSLSIAWSDGTYNNIIDMFTRNQLGHIQIHREGYLDSPALYKTIDKFEEVGNLIASVDGVQYWAPRIYSAGLLSVGEKSTGAKIIGIDPQREKAATRFDKKVVEGQMIPDEPAHDALLGEGVAKTLKAKIGDKAVIVSQGADGSIANDLYTIAGFVSTGNKIADQSSFYLHLIDAQELLVLEGQIHEISIVVKDLDKVSSIAADIETAVADPELEVAPWQEFAKQFYRAMKADQQGGWIMLAVIILVVAVGVLNTVLMTVLERTREYGVLRAIGTGSGQIFVLVLIEVFIMVVISIILAVGLSYAVNYALSIHGVAIPTTFTYGGVEFHKMYTEINARSFYIPVLCIVFSAMFVALFPAAKAAHVAPVKAMRMH